MSMDELLRSLDYSGISAILPKEVDKVIAKLMDYQNPLRQNLPRKPGSGDGYLMTAPLQSNLQLNTELYRWNPTLYDAWMAGIMDGDGSYVITKQGTFQPRVLIACSAAKRKEFLRYFRERASFLSVYYGNASSQLRISNYSQVEKFLSFVAPYAILKKSQAELLLNFVKTFCKRKVSMEARKSQYETLKELNHTIVGNTELRH